MSIAVLLLFSRELSQGIKNGIDISLNLVIPSLLMFMILSNLICSSKLSQIISKPFKSIAEYIFKIPSSAMSIVLLSLLGGYPIGARMIATSIKSKQLTVEDGERMLCFCVNCGPAFLINAVGLSIFGNAKIGLVIYLSQIVACMITGIIVSFKKPKCQFSTSISIAKNPTSIIVVSAVSDAVKTMALICGFIVTFSAFLPIIELIFKNVNSDISMIIRGLLEVTTFCGSLSGSTSPSAVMLVTIFTAFGGICVHLQIGAILNGSGVKMKKFFSYRILYTFISVVLVRTVLFLAPNELACISVSIEKSTKLFSVSPIATAFLILLSIMLLFFSKKSDKIV